MSIKKLWEKLARPVYFTIGAAGVLAFFYFLIKLIEGTFFSTMGWFGGAIYILTTVGALNWLVKAFEGRDIFGK